MDKFVDSIALSVFSSRIEAVCDEMGAVLKRVAFSPNIKDRLDYSCAVFDAAGELCAQAAHIPVHLGSMAYALKEVVKAVDWSAGDMLVLNDPYIGGTHLPDITLIAPLYIDEQLMGFVANRAHHADIGASSPGSMPVSSHLDEEGVLIAPTHLLRNDSEERQVMQDILARLQNPVQSHGDFSAQISANRRGLLRLGELIESMGMETYLEALQALNDYAERIAQASMADIRDGDYFFRDLMDDDGQGQADVPIVVTLKVRGHRVEVDFAGTAAQVQGNINCPLSVAAAAVFYVFRCFLPASTPVCAGSFRHIELLAPRGSLVNANRPAAVAAGNVETSTRIVDAVMGALAQALPGQIPAASYGSMNNVAMGAEATRDSPAWDYYETIGGGMGASAIADGLSGVQAHMTNTLNTPVEVLEMNYPLRVETYALRQGSGGQGQHRGGEGIVRSYRLLQPTQLSLLTERRKHAPWSIDQGVCQENASPGSASPASASPGENRVNETLVAPKLSMQLNAGDLLTICTPGGGGYGPVKPSQ